MLSLSPSFTSPQRTTASSGPATVEKTPVRPAPAALLPKQTVLVVDDDSALRMAAVMMLECQGFKTLAASNGLEALGLMERHPQIDAVLLDLLMPVMDGEETLRQMRNFWPAVPVILISGFDLGEIQQRLGGPPPDGVVQKPFTFAKLSGALGGVLS